MRIKKSDGDKIPPYLKTYNEGYKPPPINVISEKFDNYKGQEVADMLGANLRTVWAWKSGERNISYATWRLFLIETGEIKP